MAKYFEDFEDEIPMDDLPSISENHQEYLQEQQEEEQETSFGDLSQRSTATESRQELMRQEVKKLYNHMNYTSENLDLNLDRFKLENNKGFPILSFEKNGKWYALTRKTDGAFKEPSTIEKILTKRSLNQLGVSRLDEIVPTSKEVESLELKDLSSTITKVTDVIGETSQSSLPMRELLGLNKALQRIQGELVNGTGKLTELEQDIAENQRILKEEEPTKQEKEHVKKHIAELKEAYDIRLESLSQIREQLSSQFARIRQTIDKIADGERTLKERLKIIWREQGLTLVSVLTAVGMTISTLVLALLPSSLGGGGGSNSHKVRDWVKKSLASLARLFGRLAKWALKALPSAIASIVSWIFSLFKTIATSAGEHAYAAIGFAVAVTSYLAFKK